jgi:hypothetical protein
MISDNASDEDLASIARRYDDPRIVHTRWPDHVGTYENHNRAVALSRYDWIVPLGSDDRLLPVSLAALADRIASLAAAGIRPSMVVAACRRVDERGQPADRRYYGSQGMRRVRDGLYSPRQWIEVMTDQGAPPWNIGSVAFSRAAIVDAGGPFRPEIGLSADNELVLRLAAYGPVAYVDRPLADFTVRSDSDGNRRFTANRSSGEPETPMGAALASGFRAHAALGSAGPSERARLARAVARLHLQRAGQHRILSGGLGRRGAAADVWRAMRAWPRLLLSPSQLARALAAIAAPRRLLLAASSRLSGRGSR